MAKARGLRGMFGERLSALRGWIRAEIGRVFNRSAGTHAPAEIIVEKMDFQTPGLRLFQGLSERSEVNRCRELMSTAGYGYARITTPRSLLGCSFRSTKCSNEVT